MYIAAIYIVYSAYILRYHDVMMMICVTYPVRKGYLPKLLYISIYSCSFDI